MGLASCLGLCYKRGRGEGWIQNEVGEVFIGSLGSFSTPKPQSPAHEVCGASRPGTCGLSPRHCLQLSVSPIPLRSSRRGSTTGNFGPWTLNLGLCTSDVGPWTSDFERETRLSEGVRSPADWRNPHFPLRGRLSRGWNGSGLGGRLSSRGLNSCRLFSDSPRGLVSWFGGDSWGEPASLNSYDIGLPPVQQARDFSL
jgi:hypothetical protein